MNKRERKNTQIKKKKVALPVKESSTSYKRKQRCVQKKVVLPIKNTQIKKKKSSTGYKKKQHCL